MPAIAEVRPPAGAGVMTSVLPTETVAPTRVPYAAPAIAVGADLTTRIVVPETVEAKPPADAGVTTSVFPMAIVVPMPVGNAVPATMVGAAEAAAVSGEAQMIVALDTVAAQPRPDATAILDASILETAVLMPAGSVAPADASFPTF